MSGALRRFHPGAGLHGIGVPLCTDMAWPDELRPTLRPPVHPVCCAAGRPLGRAARTSTGLNAPDTRNRKESRTNMKSIVTIYQLTDRLRDGRRVHVSADEIEATTSAWLAELGAASPLVDDFAEAVRAGDWPKAHALSDYLSVDVIVAGVTVPPHRVRPIRSLDRSACQDTSLQRNRRRPARHVLRYAQRGQPQRMSR